MSRSNGPATLPGGRLYPAAGQDIDPQTGRPTTAGGPAQRAAQTMQPPQYAQNPQQAQGYGQPAAAQGYGQPQQGYGGQHSYAEPAFEPAPPANAYGQGYGYQPDYSYQQPNQHPGHNPGQQPGQQSSAPQADRYAPSLSSGAAAQAQPQQAAATRNFAPQFDAYVPPSQRPAAAAPEPQLGFPPAQEPRNEGLSRLSLSRGRQAGEAPAFGVPQQQAPAQQAHQAFEQWQQPNQSYATPSQPDPRTGHGSFEAGGYYPQGYEPAAEARHPVSGDLQFAEWTSDAAGHDAYGHAHAAAGHAARGHVTPQGHAFGQSHVHDPHVHDPHGHDPHTHDPHAHGAADGHGHQGHGHDPYGHDSYGHAADPAGQGYGHDFAGQHPAGEQGFDHGFDHSGHAALAGGHDHQHDDEAAEHEHDGVAAEAPSKRSSLLMVAAALTTAVVVGGGLAFGYQKLMGKPGDTLATPLVKGSGESAKSKPSDPGGKQFAHTDSKVMGRLSEGSGSTTTSSSEDPGSPRKVTTIAVGRDGSLTAPAPEQQAAAGPAAAPVSVPGMTIVDGFGGRHPVPARPAPPPPAAAQPVAVPPVAPPVASAPPAKPVVVARSQPETTIDAASDEPPAAPQPKAPRKKPVVNDAYTPGGGGQTAAVAPPSAPTPRASSGGAGGYVAVLASVPMSANSRMEALKRFADLQQRYGGVLSDKTPDVQEANLGDKGNFHRLMVGPPGSREQASGLCSQLKAAGYTDCWVKSY